MKKFLRMFRIKFPKNIYFGFFLILRITGMAPFCKLIYGTTLVFTCLLTFLVSDQCCSRKSKPSQSWRTLVHRVIDW